MLIVKTAIAQTMGPVDSRHKTCEQPKVGNGGSLLPLFTRAAGERVTGRSVIVPCTIRYLVVPNWVLHPRAFNVINLTITRGSH